MIGTVLTKPLLYGAAAVIAVLLLMSAGQGVAIWYFKGEVKSERERAEALLAKNSRCEAEAAGLKGSLTTQNQAVKDVKAACETAGKASKAALAIAKGNRGASAREIADILAGQASDADSCRSACVELRKDVRR